MSDLPISNLRPAVYDWLKAEAAASGRTIAEQAQVVLDRELKPHRSLRTFLRQSRGQAFDSGDLREALANRAAQNHRTAQREAVSLLEKAARRDERYRRIQSASDDMRIEWWGF